MSHTIHVYRVAQKSKPPPIFQKIVLDIIYMKFIRQKSGRQIVQWNNSKIKWQSKIDRENTNELH